MPITPQALDFLFENRLRDSKEWYQANKGRFKELVEAPMLELSQALGPVFQAIDPAIVTQPRRTLSRVWRDTRFTKDKTLFRDVMWLVFRRGVGMRYPAFYFEFSPGGCRWGCGYYSTPPQVAEHLRRQILADDPRYCAAQAALAARPDCDLHGDAFKRPRYTQQSPEKLRWLNLKSYVAGWNGDLDTLFSPGLPQLLATDLEALAPVYHFLLEGHLAVMEADDAL